MKSTLPKTIALGGGKGGAGRSTLALVLARQLVQRKWRVLLVDADTAAPMLHHMLGMGEPEPVRGTGIGDPNASLAPFMRPTPIDGLTLLSFAHARGYPYVRPRLNAPALIERLEDLAFDTVIMDLPPGHDPVQVALFALSDFPVLVTTDEMSGAISATQYLRAAIFHGMGFHPQCYDAEEELLMLLREQGLGMSRQSLDQPFLSAVGRRIVRETRTMLTPNLILNKSRTPKSAALANAMAMGWNHLLGLYPRALAQIPLDTNFTPPGEENHDIPGKLEAAVADLARHLEDTEGHHRRHPRPLAAATSPHGILGLSNEVPTKSLTARLNNVLAIMQDPPSVLRPLVSPDEIRYLSQELERALDALDTPEPARLRSVPPPHATLTPAAPVVTITTRPVAPPEPEPEPEPIPEPDPAPWSEPAQPHTEAHAPLLDLDPDDEEFETNILSPTEPLSAPPPIPQPVPEPEPYNEYLEDFDDIIADAHDDDDGEMLEVGAPPQPSVEPEPAAPKVATGALLDDDPPLPSPDRPSPGIHLRDIRRDQNMSLRELSLRTKIGVKYIEAIEKVDRKVLPRPVYLRGYLREIAQVFKLDESALIEDYFSYLGYP